jgi:antitoxin (DNA-binding transcriptional repressor) of toxin-antitoxin stability system
MRSRTITATNLARRLSDVLSRVRYRGERYIVERGGESIARIEPVGPPVFTVKDFIGLMTALPRPDEEFARDLEKIRRSQLPVQLREWPS